MVKVMYNDQLVYKVIIWAYFGISLWKEKVALMVYLSLELHKQWPQWFHFLLWWMHYSEISKDCKGFFLQLCLLSVRTKLVSSYQALLSMFQVLIPSRTCWRSCLLSWPESISAFLTPAFILQTCHVSHREFLLINYSDSHLQTYQRMRSFTFYH